LAACRSPVQVFLADRVRRRRRCSAAAVHAHGRGRHYQSARTPTGSSHPVPDAPISLGNPALSGAGSDGRDRGERDRRAGRAQR
jgi:hypothetical protein